VGAEHLVEELQGDLRLTEVQIELTEELIGRRVARSPPDDVRQPVDRLLERAGLRQELGPLDSPGHMPGL
jgi:hypothetical protein